MSIRDLLLIDHSRKNTHKITRLIGSRQQLFDELMGCLFSKEVKIAQRAAPVLFETGTRHPHLLKKWNKKLVTLIGSPVHVALSRNVIRLYQYAEIPDAVKGTLADSCIKILTKPESSIAEKAFSLAVLSRIGQEYPEIIREVKEIIKNYRGELSPGMTSRIGRFLKENKE